MATSSPGLALAAMMLLSAACLSGAPPDTLAPDSAVLHLVNFTYVSGTLQPGDDPERLRWQSPLFAAPLEFGLDGVKSVHFQPRDPIQAAGDDWLELTGGDVVLGTVCGLNDEEVQLDVADLGKVRVRRSWIRLMQRREGQSAPLYLGPRGMADWQSSPDNAWREESGQVLTEVPGALYGDFRLPARASIELTLSWERRADFSLAFGVGPDEASPKEAFRLEGWDSTLVILRELKNKADVAHLRTLPLEGAIRLHILLDQEAGRCLVLSEQGKRLAELTLSSAESRAGPGLRLINKGGDLRLEHLRIGPWSGTAPQQAAPDQARLRLLNATLRAERYDGIRLSGELIRVDDSAIWISSGAVREPLRLPLASLRSLTVLQYDRAPFAERVKRDAASAGRGSAMLEAEGVRLRGRLIDGQDQPPASCLIWQPLGTFSSSPLRAGASGRIVFEWQPAQPSAAAAAARKAQLEELARFDQSRFGPHLLYLRSGDTIHCEVTGMDERGVALKTSLLNATFAAHECIQAIELHQDPPIKIMKSKRDRLLTLPRMQRDNPPTHLIRSRDGDYLRGRIVGMDDRRVLVEVRLETRELPRANISRIIWLRGDERTAGAPAESAKAATRVQGLFSDGNRLTMVAEGVTGATLSGKSEVIGACQIDLHKVGQLFFGNAIEESASRLAYQQWMLKPAAEPLAQVESGADGAEGTQSNLVGKPAPDFELDLLEGQKFRLSGHRGKIIVLDFWTTWCGVCLQAMPQVAQVSRDFAGRNVQVVAVNLEESPAAITAVLQRNKLQLPVALDRDGAVSRKYGVSSLPQTLVIDPEGVIVRHFIGGGPHLGEQLSDSLKALLASIPGPSAGR